MSGQPGSINLQGRSNHLRRRQIVARAAQILCLVATVAVAGMFLLILFTVLQRGWSALNLDFFTKTPALFGHSGGGIANAIVGSLILVGLAALMAIPVAILVAMYLTEFAPPSVATAIRLTLEVLSGVPAIVIGIFVFSFLIVGNGQSGYAGAFALAVLMLPLVARAADEVLSYAAAGLREASLALGATRSRTLMSAILPTAISGIVTASVLAVARVAGETAPLLFTTSIVSNDISTNPHQPLASMPLTIFEYSESPSPAQHTQAWAASFVLIMFVLVASILARLVAGRASAIAGRGQ
jgi:phosphate transport system permease protein